MINQKAVISVESYDDNLDRYNKSEDVIIRKSKYNNLTKRLLVCKIVYSNCQKLYLVKVNVDGLRRNSKVNTINIYTLKQTDDSYTIHEFIDEISNK